MISFKEAMSKLTAAENAEAGMLELKIDGAIRAGDPKRGISVDIAGVSERVRERVAQAYRAGGWEVTIREAINQMDTPDMILRGKK